MASVQHNHRLLVYQCTVNCLLKLATFLWYTKALWYKYSISLNGYSILVNNNNCNRFVVHFKVRNIFAVNILAISQTINILIDTGRHRGLLSYYTPFFACYTELTYFTVSNICQFFSLPYFMKYKTTTTYFGGLKSFFVLFVVLFDLRCLRVWVSSDALAYSGVNFLFVFVFLLVSLTV